MEPEDMVKHHKTTGLADNVSLYSHILVAVSVYNTRFANSVERAGFETSMVAVLYHLQK